MPDPSNADTRTPEQIAFDRRVLELHREQAAGVTPPPGSISRRVLAKKLGMSERELRETEERAVEVIRRHFRKQLWEERHVVASPENYPSFYRRLNS